MARTNKPGFTIVELHIVIVVIGILAAITIVAFNGLQERSRDAKIQSDLSQLSKAVQAARVQTGKTMSGITGTSLASNCVYRPTGTDLSNKASAPSCWSTYAAALQAISDASGITVVNLTDPWNRPYLIDDNEGDSGSTNGVCTEDDLGIYSQPFVYGWNSGIKRPVQVPLSLPQC